MDKNEKYLKSIDNTLKDILKELKKSNRQEIATQLDESEIAKIAKSLTDREKVSKWNI